MPRPVKRKPHRKAQPRARHNPAHFRKQKFIVGHYIGEFGMMIEGKLYDCTQTTTQSGGKLNKTGIINQTCRRLIEEGEDSSTPIRVFRDLTRVFANDEPLSFWAGLAVSEGEKPAHFTSYTPHPNSPKLIEKGEPPVVTGNIETLDPKDFYARKALTKNKKKKMEKRKAWADRRKAKMNRKSHLLRKPFGRV